MSFAFMPFYTGDYLRDTRHLTPMRHGVYLLLLAHCWDQRGPVPLDEQESAGIANCRSADEIDALRYILNRYFIRMDDGWYNQRMQNEIERANAISMKREDAGRRGANERMRRFRAAQSDQEAAEASAKQLLSKCQASDATPTTTTTTTTKSTARSTPLAQSDLKPEPPKQPELVLAGADAPPRTAALPFQGLSIPIVGGEFPVPSDFAAELELCFPAVDVAQTLREIRAWNLANPTRRKTLRGVRRHITQWMQKVQDS